MAAPVQYAALVAYSGDPEIEEYVALCARVHAIRTMYLYELMVRLGVPTVEPSGAFYIFPCFDEFQEALAARGITNDEELAMHLLEKYELATLPGSAFYAVRRFCLRVSSSFIDMATDEKARSLAALGMGMVYLLAGEPEQALINGFQRCRFEPGAGVSAGTVSYLTGVSLEYLGSSRRSEAQAAFAAAAEAAEATLWSDDGPRVAPLARSRLD